MLDRLVRCYRLRPHLPTWHHLTPCSMQDEYYDEYAR